MKEMGSVLVSTAGHDALAPAGAEARRGYASRRRPGKSRPNSRIPVIPRIPPVSLVARRPPVAGSQEAAP